MCLPMALIVAGDATNAAATPLSPFRYEAQAQRHCPGDTVVWLDFRKEIYYLKRQKRYAQGSTGSFACRDAAAATATAACCFDFGRPTNESRTST